MKALYIAAVIAVPLLVIAFFYYEGWVDESPAAENEPAPASVGKYPTFQPEDAEPVAEIRRQFEIYDREGLSPAGREALEKINTFASTRLEGTVVFYQEAAPWVMTTMSNEPTPDLMAAYVAGVVRELLATGDLRTNSYAGTMEALRVYRFHQQQDPGLSIPELEAFELLDRKGKLRERMDKIDAKEEARHAREEKLRKEVAQP